MSVVTESKAPQSVSAFRIPPLLQYVLRRCAVGLLTLIAAAAVVFIGTSVIPGSPAGAVLGQHASPQAVAQINHRLGWDRPIPERFGSWLEGVATGDLGDSAVQIAQGQKSAPLWPILKEPFTNTAVLALATIMLLIPLSLVLGVLSGVHHGRSTDAIVSTSTLVFMSLPEFVVAAVLIEVFFAYLGVLPPVSLVPPGSSPLDNPEILILPVTTLLLVSVAATVRLVRVGTIEVLNADFVQTARLSGLNERLILWKYVLRNALAPSVQIFALSIQYLFGGVIVTEAVFSYPGLGKQLVDATLNHDNTQVQAIALILAAIYILINIIADVVVVLLVPKLRTQYQ